ncbi:oxidoreductase [Kitasatospora sp. NPDC001175]|uniref:oxidoreductase n=1 Tax=Kitasatospora sp. NPDC001175 TaxID=3157103 RepID=UPI003D034D87
MTEQPPSDWTAVEAGLWEAFRNGETYDLRAFPDRGDGAFLPTAEQDGRSGGPDSEDTEVDDPFSEHSWGPERTIRAEVIARLLLAGPSAQPGRVASLKLVGALISGRLTLAGADVTHYLELRWCRFTGKVLISEATAGTVRLVGCQLGRLEASRLTTTGDLHLARCRIDRGIRLTDARIGTDLLLNQTRLGHDGYGRAMAADGLSVSHDLEADRLEAHGELSLRSARVGGRLSLRGARLRGTADGYSLNAPRITVGHTLYLSGSNDSGWVNSSAVYGSGYGDAAVVSTSTTPFRSHGRVRISDGRFDNACLISDAEFHLGPDQDLSLNRIQTPELRFTCRTPPTGRVTLTRARVGNLVDAPGAWPAAAGVGLTGFTYESLRPAGTFTVQQRITWLENSLGEFQPEPYEQLAAALRRDGRDEDAREVQYAKQRRRRATLPLPGRLWGLLQDATVGYGYRPGRAALWLLVTWALGTLYFLGHHPAPLKADERPTWNPALFALSKVLPVVDLSQDGWNPDLAGQWVVAGLVISGWLLATTVVTSATRMLQRG